MKIPHTVPGAWPASIPPTPPARPPSRFAATIRRDSSDGCAVGLIGLADDLGVRLNNGRPGAKDGPRVFREALAKYGVAEPDGWVWPRVFDAGDVVPAPGDDAAALEQTHARVTEAVGALVKLGLVPVGIGGGHDLTFAFVRALAAGGAMSGVYFDAHLDVRETAGSGMPFRALVERCGVKRLDVFGLNPAVNSAEHAKWFGDHGGTAHAGPLRPANLQRALDGPGDKFVSLDLDVVDGAQAPGVSAVNPAGWSAQDAAAAAEAAGRAGAVRCFDIMELNPSFDEGGRTARLAAHLFLAFLRGLAARGARP